MERWHDRSRADNWSIARKVVTVTADDKTKVAGEADPELTATVQGTLGSDTVAYTLSRAAGDAVGEYAITPDGDAEQGNYAVTYVPGTLTIEQPVAKIDLSAADVSFATSSYAYNGQEQQPVPVVKLGDAVLSPSTDYTCSYASNRNVGTATVTVTGIGAYEGTATGTFEITKAPLTVRAKNHSITYGNAPNNDGVTYEGFVGDDTAASLGGTLQYAYSYEQYGNVGNAYTITPSGLTSDNYDITFEPGTLTVSPRPVELTWANTSFTYDASPHVPTATAGGLVNGDAATVTVGDAQTGAGTYTATATSVSDSNYSLPDEKTCEFTIAKASINPTVTLEGWTYGEAAKTPVVTGNLGGGDVTYTYALQGSSVIEYGNEVPEAAGRYSVRAVVAETGNYL